MRAGGRRRHQGLDYHCPIGTPIYGTEDGGRVEFIGYNGHPWMGLGHNIRIRYPSGVTVDAHMSYRSPLSVGDRVGQFTLVGRVGLSGNAINADPPGPHVHHERRDNKGLLVNPATAYGLMLAGGTGTQIEIEDDMPLNDADKDWIKNAISDAARQALGGYIIQSNDKSALVAPNFYRELNSEEFGQASYHYPILSTGANQRAFDVHRAIHVSSLLAGQVGAVVAAAASGVVTANSQDGDEFTLEQIRQAIDEAIDAGLDGLTATVTLDQPSK